MILCKRKDANSSFYLDAIEDGIGGFKDTIELIKIEGMDPAEADVVTELNSNGRHDEKNALYKERTITITVHSSDVAEAKAYYAKRLNSGVEVTLIFEALRRGEDARIDAILESLEISDGDIALTFVCPNPFFYSTEKFFESGNPFRTPAIMCEKEVGYNLTFNITSDKTTFLMSVIQFWGESNKFDQLNTQIPFFYDFKAGDVINYNSNDYKIELIRGSEKINLIPYVGYSYMSGYLWLKTHIGNNWYYNASTASGSASVILQWRCL